MTCREGGNEIVDGNVHLEMRKGSKTRGGMRVFLGERKGKGL
jgi:hypothetical protein